MSDYTCEHGGMAMGRDCPECSKITDQTMSNATCIHGIRAAGCVQCAKAKNPDPVPVSHDSRLTKLEQKLIALEQRMIAQTLAESLTSDQIAKVLIAQAEKAREKVEAKLTEMTRRFSAVISEIDINEDGPDADSYVSGYCDPVALAAEVIRTAFTWKRERDTALAKIQDLTKDRDHWKANHDNQVKLKAAVLDRPDLEDRAAKVVAMQEQIKDQTAIIARLEKERDKAQAAVNSATDRGIERVQQLNGELRVAKDQIFQTEQQRDAARAEVTRMHARLNNAEAAAKDLNDAATKWHKEYEKANALRIEAEKKVVELLERLSAIKSKCDGIDLFTPAKSLAISIAALTKEKP